MSSHDRSPAARWLPALGVWALAWAAMVLLQQRVDLANLAMVLVLASALATLWLPVPASLASSALSVLAFNWWFVPPRFTLAVDLRQDALLLGAMLGVSWIVAAVMARQRWLGERARRYGERVLQLQRLSEALRDSPEPAHQAGLLQATLAELLGRPVGLLVLQAPLPATDDDGAALMLGEPNAHERAGLWQCLRQGRAFGPGTGAHAELPEWYFPLRARQAAYGAAMVRLDAADLPGDDVRAQAQALCDLMGGVLQRAHSEAGARRAQEQAQLQQVRNALLAAISHDYRTPLAAIMGAASSLREQGERLSPAQRTRLLDSVVDETAQLARLTDNTLQLARLDAPGVQLALDWQSPEEIVGALMARLRARDLHAGGQARLRARIEPGVPLVRCDALLMMQLLENLLDNALKYSEPPAPVELVVRRQPGHVVFAVRDRGPGVEPAWRERIFQVFQRAGLQPAPTGAQRPRSAGVGLAVCRAIAHAHGGELRLRPRGHGGTAFECWLPEQVVPAVAQHEETAP